GRRELRLRDLPAALVRGRGYVPAAVVPPQRDERADGPGARNVRREGRGLSARGRLDPQLHVGARTRPRLVRESSRGRAETAPDRGHACLHVGVALRVSPDPGCHERTRAAAGLRPGLGRLPKALWRRVKVLAARASVTPAWAV